MTKILEVKDLEVSFRTEYGEIQAVRGVNFHLNKGETLAIVGESGSGKSVTTQTIVKLISTPPGMIKNGQVLYKGKDLLKMSNKELSQIRGKEIAMIFQDPMSSLNPTMKVGDQIMEILTLHLNMTKEQAKQRAIELLDLVGITMPEKRVNQYSFELSGGMSQRVMIAMALAANPEILIADEPSTALDVTIQAQILELLKDLQKQFGTSIIFITHDLGVVANVADRVAVMYAGKIVEIGKVDEIFYNPQHPYTKGLLASMPDMDSSMQEELDAIPGSPPDLLNPPKGDAFALRNPYALDIDFEKQPPLFKVSETHYAATWLLHPDYKDKAKEIEAKKAKQKTSKTTVSHQDIPLYEREKLVEVKNLKKYFPVNRRKTQFVKAIDDVSFDIYKGEIFGLVGESGSGKSTTGRSIMRLHDITDGEILFKGEPIHGKKSRRELKKFYRQVQIIFQDPYSSLNPRKTIAQSISEGLIIHGLVKNEHERMMKVYELLETVELSPKFAHRYPHEFSGGQRQRVGIARALALDPELIIADEPISALDVSIQAQIVNLLKRLQREKGLTYLFIAHDLSMVKYISDRIGVMHHGKLVEVAERDELFNHPIHPYTKSLLSAVPIPDPKLERHRTRIIFNAGDYKAEDEARQMREIRPNHFVYCTEQEAEQYMGLVSH